MLIKDFIQQHWCKANIFQLKNEEFFRELLCNLKTYYNIKNDLLSKRMSKNVWRYYTSILWYFYLQKIKHNNKEFCIRLDYVNKDVQFKDYRLEDYLLIRLKGLLHVKSKELNSLEVSRDIKNLELIKAISSGAFGIIYKSKWFRFWGEKKDMDVNFNAILMEEVDILNNSSHLNFIKYY